MALSALGEVIAHEAAFWMLAFDDPDYPLDELGELSLDLPSKLRALAVMQLLVNADSNAYQHNLIRAGRMRLRFLQRLAQAGIRGHHQGVSGRYEPVLDLIAAGAFEDAVRIGALSEPEWQHGHEYEDDYCYARMLFRLAAAPSGAVELTDLAARWLALDPALAPPRAHACAALAARDEEAFADALLQVLQAYTARLAFDKARSETVTAEIMALRHVCIEGLALLRLADARGLRTLDEYLYCPALARRPMTVPMPAE